MRFADAVARGPVVLDGGLATRLEARGLDLSGRLWSARVLVERPAAVTAAHEDFFAAGAQVATTASYQVSYDGFAAAGFDRSDTDRMLRRSVALARTAADRASGSRWVAASVGPYGAALADGSEYNGRYGLTVQELRQWHRRRLGVLAEAGADALALETIPCLAEAEALLSEVSGLGVPCWLALTVAGGRTRAGEPLAAAFAMAAQVAEVVAVGVNCCAPDEVDAALALSLDLPRVAYPNSGEGWDPVTRDWAGTATFTAERVSGWLSRGAHLVGGCCRVTPEDIASIAAVTSTHGR